MGVGAMVTAGLGAVGSIMSSRESRRATEAAVDAARFQPFSVNGPAGQVQVGADGQVNLIGDPDDLAMRNRLRAQGFGALYSGVDDLFTQPLDGGLDVMGRVPLDLSANSLLMREARQLNPNALNPMMRNMALARGQGNVIAGQGLRNLQLAMGQAGLQGAMGQQFLSQAGSTDINALASDRLAQLNALAQPGEDRMAAQLADRLFASGRNATTGGAQQFGELMQAQSRADMERRIMATQFATGEQNRLVGLGQGLIGSGQDTALGALSGAGGTTNLFAGLVGNEANLVGQRNTILGQRFQEMLGAHEFGMARGLASGNFNLASQQQRFNQQAARAEMTRANILARMGAGEGMLGLSQQFDPFNQLMAQASLSTALSSAASGAGAQMGSFIAQGGQNRANMISSMFGGLMSASENWNYD